MVAVCLKQSSCSAPSVNGTTVGQRSYVYSPTPTEPWKFAWDFLATSTNVPADLKATINSNFTFKALSYEALGGHKWAQASVF